MRSLFSPKPSIAITVEQDFLLVHPNQHLFLPNQPTWDPELRGTALLSLPQAKSVKSVRVIFEGLGDIWGGDGHPYESSPTIQKELKIDLKGEELAAGDHAFNFSFTVPSQTPVRQRCNFGRVRHYVKAFVEYGASSSVNSGPVAIFISAQPTLHPGDIPEFMEVNAEHMSDDLGPVRVTVSSPHLTASSLVSAQVILLAPPLPFTINSIRTIIFQRFQVIYKDGTSVQTPEEQFVLKTVAKKEGEELKRFPGLDNTDREFKDEKPLMKVEKGEEKVYARVMRMPDDDHVRASTVEGETEARIKLSHRLAVEIQYRMEGSDKDLVLSIGRNIAIAGCCFAADNARLPAYQPSAPPKLISTPIKANCPACVCQLPLKDLFDRDGVALEQAMELPGDLKFGSVREFGREDKTPSVAWIEQMNGDGEGATESVTGE